MNIIIYGVNNLDARLFVSSVKITAFTVADIEQCTRASVGNNTYPCIPLNKITEYDFDYIVVADGDFNSVCKNFTQNFGISGDKILTIPDFINKLVFSSLENKYQNTCDSEIKDCMKYIFTSPSRMYQVFNYDFAEKYSGADIEVFFDVKAGLYYVNYYGKKMYMSRKYNNESSVRRYVAGINMEQDPLSPHCYFTEEFCINDGDVVIDAGVAEGNFALRIIDKVKKIYLVECDEGWCEALKYTFSEYSDKVVFINKFLSNVSDNDNITVDKIAAGGKIDAIKMDIEGAEANALIGAQNTIAGNPDIRIAACAYHKHNDEIIIKELMEHYGLDTVCSRGYMLFIWEKDFLNDPEFRRGLVFSKPGGHIPGKSVADASKSEL